MAYVMIRNLFATVIGLALIISGCTVAQRSDPPPPAAAPPSKQVGPLPTDCADRITESNQARKALAQSQPGSTVCLSGDGLQDVELEVTSSGTPQQPITIVADGATVRSMDVKGTMSSFRA